MSFELRDYLRHILVEADHLDLSKPGASYDIFSADETLRRAFVRSLEIIGEAAKKVPEDFRAAYPSVEWRAMAGMPRRRDNRRSVLCDAAATPDSAAVHRPPLGDLRGVILQHPRPYPGCCVRSAPQSPLE